MTDRSMIDPTPQDVGARFDTPAGARSAVRRLTDELGVEPSRIEILDRRGRMHTARGVESQATRRAVSRWTGMLAVAGLAIGVLAWIALWYVKAATLMAMPLVMLFVLAGFGGVAGLLLAGLLSARPGKGWLAAAARDDARRGRYPVIVHAGDRDQAARALEILERCDGEPYLARAA